MSTAVATGLFTLGGVLIGGLVNYFATTRVEAVRARKQLRTAARLVGEEIEANYGSIGINLDSGSWRGTKRFPLEQGLWEEHRGILATELEPDDWNLLRSVQRGMNLIVRHTGDAEDEDATIDNIDEWGFKDVRDRVERCLPMLDGYPVGAVGRARNFLRSLSLRD
jgi:hypothetical protein